MTLTAPPLYQQIQPLDDEGKPSQSLPMQWIVFFTQCFEGDAGTTWIPTFISLTQTGTPTITGRYYKIGKYLTYFSVNIVPATNTSSTAGVTYINNFPVTAKADGACLAISGGLGGSAGMIEAATNKIWVPTWTTVTVPLTIVGIVEAY